jgi:tRNA-2-methylthio-N6-dimethylallyladenosine synthase
VEEVQAGIALELNQQFIGKIEEILVEDMNNTHGRQQWKGRNRTNKWVFFPQPGAEAHEDGRGPRIIKPGDLVKVRIERVTSWSLQGCTGAL